MTPFLNLAPGANASLTPLNSSVFIGEYISFFFFFKKDKSLVDVKEFVTIDLLKTLLKIYFFVSIRRPVEIKNEK